MSSLGNGISSKKLITVGSYDNKQDSYSIFVADEGVVTMNHESEVKPSPVQPTQYKDLNYLKADNTVESSFHYEKIKPMIKSTQFPIDPLMSKNYHTMDSNEQWRTNQFT